MDSVRLHIVAGDPLNAVIPALAFFVCTPTAVYDGDGPIWCAEGLKVRLAGISAREMDGTCKPGHPCPTSDAASARNHLASLLGRTKGYLATGHVSVMGPPLQCKSTGSAGRNRTGAWCVSPTKGDINCAMVASGNATIWPRYWKRHIYK